MASNFGKYAFYKPDLQNYLFVDKIVTSGAKTN